MDGQDVPGGPRSITAYTKTRVRSGQAAAAVTMVDCREEWLRLIGNVDPVSCAIMYGQMMYSQMMYQWRCWVLQGAQASSL